ncbi:aldo/keto reductase [Rhizomicrobium electricum]|uniref:NADP-dependent oxidoreductase domain-containing protein n=1 Tax=Rhizomicrobium electricum TaxID=480070 RepID=A0ABN1F842_9PROT|nr:aldo/keto reductase [Rhizomicrobium electricum]NIJ46742.1 aryl-alcohol dehydrogenase-like predicted oxidoreductase [Rhizomicrobium electricum]
MRSRPFGKVPTAVSEIGFGAWQIGSAWGDVSEADGRAALHAALDAGVTFVDTADVYGDGRSETIIREVLKERQGDHRAFNRHGEAFDVGETFAGVPLEIGLQAVEELKKLVPQGAAMAQFALRWILMDPAVTVVIPGARNAEQAKSNAKAAEIAPLSAETLAAARSVYDRLIAPHVHQRW